MNWFSYAATITAMTAIGLPGAKAEAATATVAGKYYRVPLTALSYHGNEMTSATGQLLVYHRDDGTTVAQLLARGTVKNSLGFALQKADAPPEAEFLFGSMDTLYVDHWQGSADPADEVVVNLTDENGAIDGLAIQLISADGTPLTAAELQYTAEIAHTPPISGTARVFADGMIKVPVISAHDNFRGRVDLKFHVKEPSTGLTFTFPDQHQSLKHAEGVTTVGIPFLNNPAAPPESVDTYSAQVFSSHEKPAAGAAVQISHPSSSGYGTHQPMQLGPEGKLFLAYPKPDHPQVRNRPRVVLVQFTDKQEPRVPFMRLEPREHKEIHPPQQITFDLVDEDGRPLELSFPATDNPHDPSIPRLMQLDVERPWGVKVEEDPGDPTRYRTAIIQEPGRYMATAKGYFFKPVQIDRTTTHVVFQVDPVPFKVSGSVVDASGKPVAEAFVSLLDPSAATAHAAVYQDSAGTSLTELWESSKGDFGKLGYYMTKTDDNGRFSVDGKYLSKYAFLTVVEPGRKLQYVINVTPSQSAPSGFNHLKDRVSGDIKLSPVVLEEDATLTLKVTGQPRKESTNVKDPSLPPITTVLRKNNVVINDDGSTATEFKGWHTRPALEAGKWNIPAPVSTTFTLIIHGIQYDGHSTTEVLNELEPGEVRDLGTIELTPHKMPPH